MRAGSSACTGASTKRGRANAGVVTEINAPSPAVVFDQIQTGTVARRRHRCSSGDAVGAGASSYAMVIDELEAIELRGT